MRINRSVRGWLTIGVGLAVTAVGTAAVFAADDNGAEPAPAVQSRTAPLPVLNFVKPGTKIDAAAPPGWTDLVLKSLPRLASGDLDTLPGSAKDTATLFHTVIMAEVRPPAGEGSEYTLKRVGLGICLPDRGHDLVVNSDSLQALGIRLSTIPKIVLGRTESEMAEARLIARTPTCAILRSPVLLRVGTKHRRVLINYAILVDPRTGALRTMVWWIDADSAARQPARELVQLKPAPLVFNCNLDVIARRLLEVPVSWSFAMAGLPPGETYAMPSRLQQWSNYDPKTVAEAATFERDLRGTLTAIRPAPSASIDSAARRATRRMD